MCVQKCKVLIAQQGHLPRPQYALEGYGYEEGGDDPQEPQRSRREVADLDGGRPLAVLLANDSQVHEEDAAEDILHARSFFALLIFNHQARGYY